MMRKLQQLVTILVVLALVTTPVAGAITMDQGWTQTTPKAEQGADHLVTTSETNPRASDATRVAGAKSDQAALSEGLRYRLAQADDSERVPVLVVFEQQPGRAFDIRSLTAGKAEAQMKSLANERQKPVLKYLRKQAARGQAAEIRSLWVRNIVAVEATPAVIAELRRSDRVARIVYDRRVSLSGETASSPVGRFTQQLTEHGNLTVTPEGYERSTAGQRVWGVEYVGADDVQERGVTGLGVNVSIVDTGINDSHPALDGQVVKWKDFTEANRSSPVDPDGHGTHVAGTVAGQPDARFAVGVAPGTNLFGARVLNEFGSGRLSDVMEGLQWSAENDADVISASLGLSPIANLTGDTQAVSSDATGSTEFEVYSNASEFNVSTNVSVDGFEPSYIFVVVEPVEYNGSNISDSSSTQARVLNNTTVALRDPDGNKSLDPVEAGYVFSNGEVPDDLRLLKYKPGTSRTVPAGNWTLNLTNNNPSTANYTVETLTVYPSNGSDELSRTVDTLAESHDVVPVIAAGNNGFLLGNRSIASPGAADGAITVGATGFETGDVARFSSRGPVAYGSETRPGIDIIAPGTGVISAYPDNLTAGAPYRELSGTSMATPHVSGTIALMLDANSSLSREDIEGTLDATAQDVPGGDNAVGSGVVDAYAAVNRTSNLSGRTVQTEDGINELFAGLGNTSETFRRVPLDPVTDDQGDASTADIRAVTADPTEKFELATYDDGGNATFRIYIDTDRNDSTGDGEQGGAEYRVIAERTVSDGVYSLTLTEEAYNSSTNTYEPTTDISAGPPDDVQSDYIEFYGLKFANENETESETLEWHVVAEAGGDTDRAPNSGQASLPRPQSVPGVAVTWNATAGQPRGDATVEFLVYDQATGELVGRSETQTDANGFAKRTFPIATTAGDDYALVVRDSEGNLISQTFSVANSNIESRLVETGRLGNYSVEEREYSAEPESTVEVNIPVYERNEDTGELVPYTGKATLRLEGNGTENVTNIDVTDGVARTTIDFSSRTVDEFGFVDMRVGLAADPANVSEYEAAGNVFFGSTVTSTVEPAVQTTTSEAAFSFQNQRFAATAAAEPMTASVNHTTYWFTDRQVAALQSEVSPSVADKLQQLDRAASEDAAHPTFTVSERREIKAAADALVDDDAVSITVTNGTAASNADGVGTFTTTPPEEARFGITFVGPDRREVGSDEFVIPGAGVVFVDERQRQFANNDSAPAESDRYEVIVEGRWDDQQEGDYIVPNSTIDVEVGLYDTETDTYVDNATVNLYATSGNTTTVTTNGSQLVTVKMAAPTLDWPNTSFDARTQQVVGIAQGYQTADGRAVAGEQEYFGTVFNTNRSFVRATPRLTYHEANETLSATLEYRNESFVDANATDTLLVLSTPSTFFTRRDVNVSLTSPPSDTSEVTYDFPESIAPDVRRRYTSKTQTATAEDFGFEFVSGLRVRVDAPDTIQSGTTTNVTVQVRDRNGTAVPNATVVWSYLDVSDRTTDPFSTAQGRSPDGQTFVGTTDANGNVTFEIAPERREAEAGLDRRLLYDTGVATENVSYVFLGGDTGSIAVTDAATRANVTGQFVDADGNALSEDFAVANGNEFIIEPSTATGNFSIDLVENETYSLTFAQTTTQDSSELQVPLDGVADIHKFEPTINVSDETDLGTVTVPDAYQLDVRVRNESGAAVENASVTVRPNQRTGARSPAIVGPTNANGYLQYVNVSHTGVEVVGNVTVEVEPPENSTRYSDTTVTRQLDVQSNQTMNVTLESRRVTVSGQVVDEDGNGLANDLVVANDGEFVTERSNETGAINLSLLRNETYSLGFVQYNESVEGFSQRDGTTDVYEFVVVNVSSDTDLGTVTIPNGSVVNVRAVNESGAPVENASVVVRHNSEPDVRPVGLTGQTNANGYLQYDNVSEPGLELSGNVTIKIEPAQNSSEYENETYTRTLNVTADTNVTVTLNETDSATPTSTPTPVTTRTEGPGFGLVVALVALLASTLLFVRRRD